MTSGWCSVELVKAGHFIYRLQYCPLIKLVKVFFFVFSAINRSLQKQNSIKILYYTLVLSSTTDQLCPHEWIRLYVTDFSKRIESTALSVHFYTHEHISLQDSFIPCGKLEMNIILWLRKLFTLRRNIHLDLLFLMRNFTLCCEASLITWPYVMT